MKGGEKNRNYTCLKGSSSYSFLPNSIQPNNFYQSLTQTTMLTPPPLGSHSWSSPATPFALFSGPLSDLVDYVILRTNPTKNQQIQCFSLQIFSSNYLPPSFSETKPKANYNVSGCKRIWIICVVFDFIFDIWMWISAFNIPLFSPWVLRSWNFSGLRSQISTCKWREKLY